MTTTVVEAKIIELLARIVAEVDEEDPKSTTGSDLPCSQPILGRWISDCDFPFLMETLALPDSVFKQEFPGIELTQQERAVFAKLLRDHCTECARCGAKQAEDDDWKLRVEKAFAKHKEMVKQVLTQAAGKP